MAKKSKIVSGLNMTLLNQIDQGNGGVYVSRDDAAPFLSHNPPLIEVNTQLLDQAGNAASRITEAGKAFLLANVNAPATATAVTPFEVMSGVVIPESKRGNRKGAGAPTQYPFDKMEIGSTFFVPISDKHPDPVKSLGSTVSSANMRYALKTGETKTVERTKRGPKNKAVLNPDGSKVKETAVVPVYKLTRKFVIRPIEAGKQYGSWTAPASGALIARVPLPVDAQTTEQAA